MKNIFYVYAYLDPTKPGKYEFLETCFLYKPFYIGKGQKNRYLQHLKDTKKY